MHRALSSIYPEIFKLACINSAPIGRAEHSAQAFIIAESSCIELHHDGSSPPPRLLQNRLLMLLAPLQSACPSNSSSSTFLICSAHMTAHMDFFKVSPPTQTCRMRFCSWKTFEECRTPQHFMLGCFIYSQWWGKLFCLTNLLRNDKKCVPNEIVNLFTEH